MKEYNLLNLEEEVTNLTPILTYNFYKNSLNNRKERRV